MEMQKNNTTPLNLTLQQVTESSLTDYTDRDLAIFSTINHLMQPTSVSPKFILILFVTQGQVEIHIDTTPYCIHQNEMLFCAPGTTLNASMLSPDFQGKVICMSNELMRDSLHNGVDILEKIFYISSHPVIQLSKSHMEYINLYTRVLGKKIKEPAAAYKMEIIHSILRAIIYEFLAYIEKENPQDEQRIAVCSQGNRLVQRFLTMLASDTVRSRFVTDYASRLCVTPKYLSAVCKHNTGKTASVWIDEFVVKDAKQLLLYSDSSIKEIAQELGFPNLSFFGKYIKAQLGLSPTAYRNAMRRQAGGPARDSGTHEA